MRRATLLMAVVVFTPIRVAAGQEVAPAPGARIRISAQGLGARQVVGTVVELRGDSLVFAPQSGHDLISVSLESLQHLEVSQSRSSVGTSILKHAGIGLLVGATGGALAGPLVLSPACDVFKKDLDTELKCLSDLADGAIRVRAAVLFGVAGGALGAVIGAIVGRRAVGKSGPGPPPRLCSAAAQRGIALAASVRF